MKINMLQLTGEKKAIIGLTVVTAVLSGAGAILLPAIVPEYTWEWYPYIPIFFYLFSLFYISIFKFSHRVPPSMGIIVLLGAKMIKMLVSVAIMAVYAFAIKTERLLFIGTYMVFYFIFLILETYFFFRYEKRI